MNLRRKHLLRGICGLLAAAVVVGWGFGQTTMESKDGVVVVKNGRKPSPPPGAAAKLVLEPVFAIGGGDNPEQEFSSIAGIAVSDKGTVYVLDMKECQVKAFDEKGKYLFSFGRKGQGPGELNGPAGIRISREKEIVIDDVFNGLVIFDLEGKFLRSRSLAQVMGITGIVLGPEGRLAGRVLGFDGQNPAFEIKTFDKDLKPLKSLGKTVIPMTGSQKMDTLSSVSELVLSSDAEGRLFLGSSKGYLIQVFDFEGRLLRTIEREYIPIPIQKADQEEFLELIDKTSGKNAARLKDMIVFPEKFPAYYFFVVNPDGRLLVRTFEKGLEAKSYYHDVFDRDGRYFSRVAMRADNILAWRDDKIFGMEINDDGYQILKCFRTRWEK